MRILLNIDYLLIWKAIAAKYAASRWELEVREEERKKRKFSIVVVGERGKEEEASLVSGRDFESVEDTET